MASKQSTKVLNFITWLTGVMVSLAVGFALISGTLSVPYVGIINNIAGLVVVITTLFSVVLALLNK